MSDIDTTRLQQAIAEKLRRWVETLPDPDEPIVALAGDDDPSEPKTPRQIYEAVAGGSPHGRQLVQRWVELATQDLMEAELGAHQLVESFEEQQRDAENREGADDE